MTPQGPTEKKEWKKKIDTTHNTKILWSQWTMEEKSSLWSW